MSESEIQVGSKVRLKEPMTVTKVNNEGVAVEWKSSTGKPETSVFQKEELEIVEDEDQPSTRRSSFD